MTGTANVIRSAADECVIRCAAGDSIVSKDVGKWVLAATILGSSMASIDGTVVNVALPTMQRDLHAGAADLQWVIEIYSLFLSALILVGGTLGDRVGRRRIYAIGVAIFAVASIACGIAPNVGALVAARALQGIGGALLVPGSLAIIGASFDEERRGRAIGTWAGFSTVMTALGPVLGGWLVQNVSWRSVFFINVPLAILTLVLIFRHVPESRDVEIVGGLDWLGAALITTSLGALVYGLIAAGSRGLSDGVVLAALGAGAVLLGLFVVVEARSNSPMLPLQVFRSRAFSGANLLTLLLYGALGGSLYFLPFNLQQVQGYSPAEAGAALLPFTLVVFLLSRWTGGLVARYGAKRTLIVGPAITAAGFILFALPDIGGSYWTTFFPAIMVMSFGMAVVIAPLTTTVMNTLDTQHSGIASGVNNAVSRTAGLLAIAVLGLVAAATFNSGLDSRLTSLHASGPARAALHAQRSKLAGASIPSGTPAARARLRRAVNEAFVQAFRIIMLVAAGLALTSALVSASLIPGIGPAPAARAAPGRSRREPQPRTAV